MDNNTWDILNDEYLDTLKKLLNEYDIYTWSKTMYWPTDEVLLANLLLLHNSAREKLGMGSISIESLANYSHKNSSFYSNFRSNK